MEILLTDTARLRSDNRQWHLESRNRKGDGKLTGWTKRGSYPRISDIAATAVVDMLLRDGTATTTFARFTESLAAIAASIGSAVRPEAVVRQFVEICNTTTSERPPRQMETADQPKAADGVASTKPPLVLPARAVWDKGSISGRPFVVYCSQEGSSPAGTLYGRFESEDAFLDENPDYLLDMHIDKRTEQTVWDIVLADAVAGEANDTGEGAFDDCL